MWAFDCGYIAPAKWGSDVSLYSFLNSGPIVAFAALFMLMNPDILLDRDIVTVSCCLFFKSRQFPRLNLRQPL